ncbi:MAG TPA: hypothetical protein DCX54_12825 [Flavobacteriales bacterium]|nr:hypothetical protein [Flavobacteriales bacterium]
MNNLFPHTFHIPVMGLGYTIDTPVKVARFGITSVVSIIQDTLVEQVREFYCKKTGEEYIPIPLDDIDHRAKRITAYLNLIKGIVEEQVEKMKKEPFEEGKDIVKYFELLPNDSPLKELYKEMKLLKGGSAKAFLQKQLRDNMVTGEIDVNIMTKLDSPNYAKNNELLPVEYCDAMAALRGYAKSDLSSSLVLSAGLNPRLFSYMEEFQDFFPDENGEIKKKVILKVSDYRSALIQGKYLAKKGIWISEFRIESGLNCGGHAFPTEGKLLGPILEEFKINKSELVSQLLEMCNATLEEKNQPKLKNIPMMRITVQGGIGTAKEDKFLREYYNLDGTGWGSPFLLVPEATNVDDETLNQLIKAKKEDYYLSFASPLGIPFNNFRKSSAELQRHARIEKNRPGSPCNFQHLASNTEFTERPICTASREYQRLKIKALNKLPSVNGEIKKEIDIVTEKDCLCEGLSSTVLLKNNIPVPHKLEAVTICPGPNLAYFSEVFSLEQMVGHIYGRINNLNLLNRSHVFINELVMYVDYLKSEIQKSSDSLSDKRVKYFSAFKANLLNGIDYYIGLAPNLQDEKEEFINKLKEELEKIKNSISEYSLSEIGKLAFQTV